MTRLPRITIALPVRNGIRFLKARVDSIRAQTFSDWEVVVVDGNSNDGTWEYLQEWATEDSRVRCEQQAPSGIYQAFNRCLALARGEAIYMATADDTMSPECLRTLLQALDRHSDCGIAHCCLTFIDASSAPISEGHCWENLPSVRYLADWMGRNHVRERGHDTVLALAMGSVYYSLTQLLVQCRTYKEAGTFRTNWGSFADLEWQMRAALVTKTVHVPEYLATWRLHSGQASQVAKYEEAVTKGVFLEMADEVISFSKRKGLPSSKGLPDRLRRFYWNRKVRASLASRKSRFSRLGLMLRAFPGAPREVIQHYRNNLLSRWSGASRSVADEIENELRELNIPPIRQVNAGAPATMSSLSARSPVQ